MDRKSVLILLYAKIASSFAFFVVRSFLYLFWSFFHSNLLLLPNWDQVDSHLGKRRDCLFCAVHTRLAMGIQNTNAQTGFHHRFELEQWRGGLMAESGQWLHTLRKNSLEKNLKKTLEMDYSREPYRCFLWEGYIVRSTRESTLGGGFSVKLFDCNVFRNN